MKAFELQPGNSRIQILLVNLIEQQSSASNINTKSFTALYDSTLKLYNSFPPLQRNSKIVNLLYKMELKLAGFYYYTGNATKGIRYKTEFENLADQTNIELTYNTKMMVEQNYSSISVFYFKHNNVSKAKAAIKQALKYYPDSFILQERYKALR